MFRASAGLTPRPDFAFFSCIAPEQGSIFVIYFKGFFSAKLTKPWFGGIAARKTSALLAITIIPNIIFSQATACFRDPILNLVESLVNGFFVKIRMDNDH